MTKKTKPQKTVKNNKKKKTTAAVKKKTTANAVRPVRISAKKAAPTKKATKKIVKKAPAPIKKKAAPTKKVVKKTVPASHKKKTAPVKKAVVTKKKNTVVKKKVSTTKKVPTSKKKGTIKKQPKKVPPKAAKKTVLPKNKTQIKRTNPVKHKMAPAFAPTSGKISRIEKKPFSVSSVSPYHNKDIDTLCSGFWGDLDLFAFKNVIVDGSLIDVAYASDEAGLIVHVLSDEREWTVDTKTDTWTNGQTTITSLVSELLKQKVSLHNVEPNARITPAILLMRGSVKDEARLQAYLQQRNVLLLRFDETIPGHAPTLKNALADHFMPALSSSLSEQEWRQYVNTPSARQMDKVGLSGKSAFTKKERNSVAAFLATVGHAGYFPKGSGTLGSVIALPVAYLLSRTYGVASIWLVSLILLFIGVWAVKRFTWNKVDKDPSSVIIDEFVGQLIPFAFVIPTLLHWPLLLLGFIGFRFFDIFKFGLVKYFDKQENAWGVMMDDVIAGLQTAIILLLAQAWWILL